MGPRPGGNGIEVVRECVFKFPGNPMAWLGVIREGEDPCSSTSIKTHTGWRKCNGHY